MSYTIRSIKPCALKDIDFSVAERGVIGHVWPSSGTNRPLVEFRLLHDARNLYVNFCVSNDHGVRIAHRGIQVPVHLDSCCEIFVRPKLGKGYFNFEMNAGGSLTLMYIEDPSRTETGFNKYERLPAELCRTIEIIHSMPDLAEKEIPGPTNWTLRYRVPFALFEKYVGPLEEKETTWLGALFSCAEETQQPYWQSWTPIPSLNFHNVLVFRDLILEGDIASEKAAPQVACAPAIDLPDECCRA